MTPIVLDLDHSIGTLAGEQRIDLRRWHDRLRLMASWSAMKGFAQALDAHMPDTGGPVLLGSGDFHHLSLNLIARHRDRPIRVVVFDNHPDNSRHPSGVHCGSWIAHAAALPHVEHIDIVGITSSDMGLANAWNHRLKPLLARKLTYWTLQAKTDWMSWFGVSHANRNFGSAPALVDAFCAHLRQTRVSTYLSLDKDVLGVDQVQTNWDQGKLQIADLQRTIGELRGQIVAADITGEISHPQFSQWYKTFMRRLDGDTPTYTEDALRAHQARQHACNVTLVTALQEAMVPDA